MANVLTQIASPALRYYNTNEISLFVRNDGFKNPKSPNLKSPLDARIFARIYLVH